VRTGTEGERGRIVFDWSERVPHSAERSGDVVRLRFGRGRMPDLAGARRVPRNVMAVTAETEAVVVTLVPGARSRVFVLGNRIVLDALDAAPGAAAAPAPPPPPPRPTEQRRGARAAASPVPGAAGARAAAAAGGPEPQPAAPPTPRPAAAAPPAAPAAPAPTSAVAQSPLPPASSVRGEGAMSAARIVAGSAGPALLVPADPETGAAAFRRGEEILVAFDAGIVPDVSALATDPRYGGLRGEAFPGGVLLRLPAAPPAGLTARRTVQGWLFELVPEGAAPPARALTASVEEGDTPRIVLRAARPGRIVAITDPETGGALLVATLREEGQAVTLPRALAEARLLPTMLGAVVLPRSDHLIIRSLPDRIVLQGSAQAPLQLRNPAATTAPVDISAMPRLLDLPQGDRPALLERLRQQQAEIADAPPLARLAARRQVAETMLALGLAQEAQSVAALALREDPRARDDARLLLVHGAAAVAAHRPSEAGTLDESRLAEMGEAALWRALRRAGQGAAAEAGAGVAAALPLLLGYPGDLRARLLPMAAESLAEAGERDALRRLAGEAPDLPAVAFAEARRSEAEDRVEEALAQYAAIGAGHDRRLRARALRRAAELRYARGMTDAAGTAAAMDALVFAWRGDADEMQLRLRVAELRRAAGMPRAAFTALEDMARLFPDQAAAIRPMMEDALAEAIATEPPLAAVTLYEAHGAVLTGAAAERAATTLADRLVALDLAEQAARLLREAMGRAPADAARAGLGARLAALLLEEGDAGGAQAALTASMAEGVDPELATRRALLSARTLAAQGEPERAAEILTGLGPAGAAQLAALRASLRDWPAAAAALARHLESVAPDHLDAERQGDVAQLAAYLALAGDAEGLAALRARYGAGMSDGPFAEGFALLTGDPMRGIADLPRLSRELEMLRILPTRLEALRSGAPTTR